MRPDLNRILATIEAAQRVYASVVALAEDAAQALSTSDQGELRNKLMDLREQNEEGFARLDAKLAAAIAKGADRE